MLKALLLAAATEVLIGGTLALVLMARTWRGEAQGVAGEDLQQGLGSAAASVLQSPPYALLPIQQRRKHGRRLRCWDGISDSEDYEWDEQHRRHVPPTEQQRRVRKRVGGWAVEELVGDWFRGSTSARPRILKEGLASRCHYQKRVLESFQDTLQKNT